jgi:hypothetical protein
MGLDSPTFWLLLVTLAVSPFIIGAAVKVWKQYRGFSAQPPQSNAELEQTATLFRGFQELVDYAGRRIEDCTREIGSIAEQTREIGTIVDQMREIGGVLEQMREIAGIVDEMREIAEIADQLRSVEAAVSAGTMSTGTEGRTNHSPSAPPQRSRRSSPRHEYRHVQKLAPYDGAAPPRPDDFREVECCDLSSTGFAFLTSEWPSFESLVIRLGQEPAVVYLTARIANQCRLTDGSEMYRVGCQFTGRVPESTLTRWTVEV